MSSGCNKSSGDGQEGKGAGAEGLEIGRDLATATAAGGEGAAVGTETRSSTQQEAYIAELLKKARGEVEGSNPSKALALVLQAVRLTKGQSAVVGVLNQTRANYEIQQHWNKGFEAQVRSIEGIDASLHSMYLHAKTEEKEKVASSTSSSSPSKSRSGAHSSSSESGGDSILAGTNREQYLDEALSDGSSRLCPMCKGIVKAERYDAHVTMWCDALPEGQ